MYKKNTKIKIVIAEDEDDIREMYVMAFSRCGFDVLEAKNGIEALEWIEREHGKIGAVILDVIMPKMDGFQVLERIKKDDEYKKIPVIMASNLDHEDDKKEALRLGAMEFFEKVKWDPLKLSKKVGEICFWSEDGSPVCATKKKPALKKAVMKAVKKQIMKSPKKFVKKEKKTTKKSRSTIKK